MFKNKKLKDENNKTIHDTEKPVEMMELLVKNSSEENLHLLQDGQDEFLKHGETVKIDADNAIKYQAECSKMLGNY